MTTDVQAAPSVGDSAAERNGHAAEPPLGDPSLYLNRELSWLAFDARVFAEARDRRHPLLERVKFVAIGHSNLDEYYMIRVSGLQQQVSSGLTEVSPDGLTSQEQLATLRAEVGPMLRDALAFFRHDLMPELDAAGVHVLDYAQLSRAQQKGMREYFGREVFPVLTPLALDPGHPFPHISNLSLNLAVVVQDPQAGERFARMKVPGVLPRLVPCPADAERAVPQCFVWLEQVIAANLSSLFPGFQVTESYAFRVTRDADVEIQEDEASDLLRTVEQSLRRRQFGDVCRLEIDAAMPARLRDLLIANLLVDPQDVYPIAGPLGLSDLMEIWKLDRPDLKDPVLVPRVPAELADPAESILDVVGRQDLLLHHPYDSFEPVIDLINTASKDPGVLAIKQTLYRVGSNSPVVRALAEARDDDTQVAVLVELKARFDEENNIEWARALERAGVHVSYGFLGLKTHCKLALVVRRDADGLRRYVHVGTGNYNPTTARLYTDLCLLTTRPDIGADVSEIFNYLTGYSRQSKYRKLLVAPVNMREALTERIRREVNCHQRDGGGRLVFKVNALVDPALIAELYRAAQAGVRVDLLVRGICCLHPDVPGISEGIRVISIVGRFLEHSRVYYFRNGGVNEEVYIGSADLMPRNLDYRVESLVPLEDPRLVADVKGILEGYLRDNVQATELGRDGKYHPRPVDADHPPHDMQAYLVAQIGVSRLLAGVGSGR